MAIIVLFGLENCLDNTWADIISVCNDLSHVISTHWNNISASLFTKMRFKIILKHKSSLAWEYRLRCRVLSWRRRPGHFGEYHFSWLPRFCYQIYDGNGLKLCLIYSGHLSEIFLWCWRCACWWRWLHIRYSWSRFASFFSIYEINLLFFISGTKTIASR